MVRIIYLSVDDINLVKIEENLLLIHNDICLLC